MVNMCKYFGCADKEYIDRADFIRDKYNVRPYLFENVTFDDLDLDKDGKLTRNDFALQMAVYRHNIYHAIEQDDDGWLRKNYVIPITAKWCKAHFALPPVSKILCSLTVPIWIFQGCDDANIPASDVLKIQRDFCKTGQNNLHIRTSRANSAEQERHIPLNTRGNCLLAGNVYCGHCGARLSLTTNGKAYPCKEDPNRVVKRVRYVCYGKTRKQTDCDGQTGYTAHILDGIIDKLVRQIFERMKAIPKSDIVNIRYREKMEERKSLLHSVRAEYSKAAADLETLKGEVIKTIRGESTFSKELLSSLIAEAEAKCQELQENMEKAQAAYDEGKTVLASLNAQYDDIISWAEMYDTASMEAKKMIVNCLIKRVDVYRDYKLHIDFNIDFEQFCGGLDIVTIAAQKTKPRFHSEARKSSFP